MTDIPTDPDRRTYRQKDKTNNPKEIFKSEIFVLFTAPANCADVKVAELPDGIYTIDSDGEGSLKPFEVRCKDGKSY